MPVPGKPRASDDRRARKVGRYFGLAFSSLSMQFVPFGDSGACRQTKGARMERMRSH